MISVGKVYNAVPTEFRVEIDFAGIGSDS